MLTISQYIESKTKELDEFREFIKRSDTSVRELSHVEWQGIYFNWAERTETIKEVPRILLSED